MTAVDTAAALLLVIVGLTLVAHGYNTCGAAAGWPAPPAGSAR